MDVGFNNTNTLHLALENEYFKDVEWLIEATSEEKRKICEEYRDKMKWEHVSTGWGYSILELELKAKKVLIPHFPEKIKKETMSVVIDFTFAIVNGHKIAFYTSNAWVVHHLYIEAFLSTYFQRTHDNYSRWNQTDASNAHNCFLYLEDIDKEPRNTTYKPASHEKMYNIFKPIK